MVVAAQHQVNPIHLLQERLVPLEAQMSECHYNIALLPECGYQLPGAVNRILKPQVGDDPDAHPASNHRHGEPQDADPQASGGAKLHVRSDRVERAACGKVGAQDGVRAAGQFSLEKPFAEEELAIPQAHSVVRNRGHKAKDGLSAGSQIEVPGTHRIACVQDQVGGMVGAGLVKPARLVWREAVVQVSSVEDGEDAYGSASPSAWGGRRAYEETT